MAQLSAAMGIASPSIYCAFGNKSALFLEAVSYYSHNYWEPLYEKYCHAPDIHMATRDFFAEAARILLSPNAPCGCLLVLSAMTLPKDETDLLAAINAKRRATRQHFRQKLKEAVETGQIPADSDIPAIAAALHTFFEALSIQARGDVCLSELLAIAALGVNLVPAQPSQAPN